MGRKVFFIGFFLFSIILAHHAIAQKKQERQVRRLETEAEQLYNSSLWNEALEVYLLLDSMAPENPEYQFRLGIIYYHSIDKARSLNYFLSSIKNGKADPNLDFYLGRAYHFNLSFDLAIQYYRRALQVPDSVAHLKKSQRLEIEKHIQDCRLAAKYIQDPLITPIRNIGNTVNSIYPEYVPLVSADESKMIFTSRRPNTTGRSVDARGLFREDIYIVYKNSNGDWGKPDNDLRFNTSEHDACVGLSLDGNHLILYRSDNGGDLYISEYDGNDWLEPHPLTGINTANWESSACFSADGRFLYFTSDKPGGYGGSDIYRARVMDTGTFSDIENLGPVINTAYDEDAPQIHSDNKTLFFSSKGHQGLGGYDIYSSIYNEDTGQWEQPRNIGYPINTPDDDIYFTLLSNGTKGFFSSYRNDSFGEKDIYMITRPQSVPTKFLMKFKLYDPYFNRPIHAKITITNTETQDILVLNPTDTIQGKYAIPLDFEKRYKLGIEAEGYQFKEKDLRIDYRADIFEYVMNVLPRRDEVITLMDSVAFVEAMKSNREGKEEQDMVAKSIRRSQLYDNAREEEVLTEPSDESSASQEEAATVTGAAAVTVTPSGGQPDLTSGEEENFPAQEASVSHKDLKNRTVGASITDNQSDESPVRSTLSHSITKAIGETLALLAVDNWIKDLMKNESEVILLTRKDRRDKVMVPIINFSFNSYALKEEYQEQLSDLAGFMERNQQLHLIINGHTDSIGTGDYNQRLSKQRAESVKELLVKYNVPEENIHATGLSEYYPILSNKTALGRRINRRVSLDFIDIYNEKYTQYPYDSILHETDIAIFPDKNKQAQLVIWEKLPVAVHFAINEAWKITEYSSLKLEALVQYIQKIPHTLVMGGFVEGREEIGLSRERESTVWNYLKALGLPEDRMMIMDPALLSNIYDVRKLPDGIERRRVQFFLIRD